MDKQSQKVFDRLVKLQPHELTESDIEFLRARRFYLTDGQKELFGKALGLEEKKAK